MRLVPTSSYKRNISIGRLLFEISYANSLKREWKKEKAPDLIIVASTGQLTAYRPVWPYMKEHNVPVIYDIMDVSLIDGYLKVNRKALYPIAKIVLSLARIREKVFYYNISGVIGLGR